MIIRYPNNEIEIEDYIESVECQIREEISSCPVEFLAGVDKNIYTQSLTIKYSTELTIYFADTERCELREKIKKTNRYDSEYTEYAFSVAFKYTGDIKLLRIKPNNRHLPSFNVPIEVIGDDLILYFTSKSLEKSDFEKVKGEYIGNAFMNIDMARCEINIYNERLPIIIEKIFDKIKKEKENEYRLLEELGLKSSQKICYIPIIKRVFSKPELLPNGSMSYSLKEDIYKDILKAVYNLYKDTERYKSIYDGKKEPELRDYIIPSLNIMFIGMNSSAETFNCQGKTDIITKAPDGNNVFIAECKIWHGESELSRAIDQLLRYNNWRDGKAALIVFVKEKGIIDIIEKANDTMRNHDCCIRFEGQTEQSSFSYSFHQKEDVKQIIAIELMLFHFPINGKESDVSGKPNETKV
jgi:hypothetical protein